MRQRKKIFLEPSNPEYETCLLFAALDFLVLSVRPAYVIKIMKASITSPISAFKLLLASAIFAPVSLLGGALCSEHIVDASSVDHTSRLGSSFICGFSELNPRQLDPCTPPPRYLRRIETANQSHFDSVCSIVYSVGDEEVIRVQEYEMNLSCDDGPVFSCDVTTKYHGSGYDNSVTKWSDGTSTFHRHDRKWYTTPSGNHLVQRRCSFPDAPDYITYASVTSFPVPRPFENPPFNCNEVTKTTSTPTSEMVERTCDGDNITGSRLYKIELEEEVSMHDALQCSGQESDARVAWLDDFEVSGQMIHFSGQTVRYTAHFEGLECGAKYEFKAIYLLSPDGACADQPQTIERVIDTARVFDGEHRVNDDFPVKKNYRTTLQRVYAEKIEDPRPEDRERCCSSGAAGSGGGGSGSIHWFFSMGKMDNGESAGSILLNRKALDWMAYHPRGLQFSGPDEVEVIRGSDGALRQVKAPQALADIVLVPIWITEALGTYGYHYEIRFYHADDSGVPNADKIYEPTGSPFTTWTVRRPIDERDAPEDFPESLDIEGYKVLPRFLRSTRQIAISEERSGHIAETRVLWSVAENSWTQIEGGGLRVVSRANATDGNGDRVETTKVKTVSDGIDGDGDYFVDETVALHYQTTFAEFDWGERRIKKIEDPDGAALTTTWVYYDNPSDGDNFGKLKQRTDPTGYWERYEYDGEERIRRIVSQFLDSDSGASSGHRVVEVERIVVDLDNSGHNDELTRTVTEIDGIEVTREHEIKWGALVSVGGEQYRREWTVKAQSPGASWNPDLAPDNLVSETLTHAEGEFEGRIYRRTHPNGTIDLYDYSRDPVTGELTTNRKSGGPNGAGDDVETGTEAITVVDLFGNRLEYSEIDIESGVLLHAEITTDTDDFGRPTRIDYLLSYTYLEQSYSDCGCGLAWTRDKEGIVTDYGYDALGRRQSVTRAGVTTMFQFDAVGNRTRTTRIGSDVSEIVQSIKQFDLAGRLRFSTDATNELTEHRYEQNGNLRRTVFPDDSERIEEFFPDGNRKAVYHEVPDDPYAPTLRREYNYGVDLDFGRWVEGTRIGLNGPTEWTRTYTDMIGRTVRREYPGPEHETWEYNSIGQLTEQTDPDGVITRYAYNSLGEREITAIVIDGTSELAFAGEDRIRRTTRKVLPGDDPENTRGEDIVVTIEEAWTEKGIDAPEEISRRERSTSGLRAWEIRAGATGSTVTSYDFSGSAPVREVRSTKPDGSYSIAKTVNGRLQREARYGPDDTLLHETIYTYDDHGRREFADDLRNGRTIFQYDDADRVWKVMTPPPAAGHAPQTKEYVHDAMGRRIKVIHPDLAETHFRYFPTGQLKKTWGARTYPVEYTYDPQGRIRTMTTWREFDQENGEGISEKAVTTWTYHPERGWLDNKRHDDGNGPDYTYWPSGRLKNRTWARQVDNQPLVTTYTYNEAGDLWTIAYSDDTPSATHTYDRLGRLETTQDAAGLLTRGYTSFGALEYENYTGTGLLDGISITRGYDSRHRLRSVGTEAGYGVTYLFDHAGRLSRVSEGHHWADLGYEPGTEILESVGIHRVGLPRLRHERSVDKLGRTEWVKTVMDGSTVVHRAYTLNDANQRTIVEHEDGRVWHYGYDDLGQVTSAHKRLSADPQSAILPGYGYGYGFDDIGNRESATRNSRTASYTPNLLNQYEEREIPGYIDVLGEAHTTATVTVDGQPTQRTGRDFRREIVVANSASPVYSSIEVEAAFDSQQVDETRLAFKAKDPELFVHDADGNLESDGRWDYFWDAENRLKAVQTRPSIANLYPNLKQRLEFVYDFQGRRIQKAVKDWDTGSSTWQTTKDLRFVYDGWNLIEERDALNGNAVVRRHVWGPDMSGTVQGAGGVGGLLWTQTPTQTFAASTDANGNVVAWVNTATLAVAGRLDYSPFGEPIVQTGVAKELPFGFSTKYEDAETGLLYYGYRFYDPETGRWPNRDPIEEDGGLNLYGFVGNDGVNVVDIHGLSAWRQPDSWSDLTSAEFVRQGRPPGVSPSISDACGTDERNVWDTFPGSGGVSFTAACIGHDLCWSTCATEGNFNSHRRECDRAFLSDMRAACIAEHGSLWNWARVGSPLHRCLAIAESFYIVVSFADGAYEDAQIRHCEVCP